MSEIYYGARLCHAAGSSRRGCRIKPALLGVACISMWQQSAWSQPDTERSVFAVRAAVHVSSQRTETQVGVMLSLPLDEFGAGGPATQPAPRASLISAPSLAAPKSPRGAKQETKQETKLPTEPEHTEPVEAAVEAGQPDQPSTALPRDLVLSSKLIARLLRRALALDGSQRRGRRLAALADRSKSSGWLPELSLRAGRSTDQSLRLTPTSSDPYRYTQSDGSDLYGEVKLSWKLDRVLFSREELGLQRLAQSEQARRDQVAERLLSAVFDWQLAELRSRDVNQTPEDQLRFALLAAQARLRLDVITGGLFGRLAPTPEASEKEPER